MKKPLPLTARSSEFPVVSMLPCENCWATSETATPLPTALAPTPCWLEENRSENSVREPLNPTVAAFARLLDVTDRSSLAAFRPVRAMLKDMRESPYEISDYWILITELKGMVPLLVLRSSACVDGSSVTLV